ncbi:hypothetical protein AGMMS50229_11810 [Campylobacterota bacterium]|nr:hypothetical protein AGMMS50229_11810 [Campylobacterota bacterium]
MRLSAPKTIVFWIATIIAILAVISFLGAFANIFTIPLIAQNAFWFLTGAYVLLALGNVLKGL